MVYSKDTNTQTHIAERTRRVAKRAAREWIVAETQRVAGGQAWSGFDLPSAARRALAALRW